jgi:hypothetical protein
LYFKRNNKFIVPQELTLRNGSVGFSETNRALTFLYGCKSVKLSNVKLKVTWITERLNEIQPNLKTLKMVDVNEDCPFTETTLKLSTIEKLSLKNCKLKVEDKLDTLCHLKTLKFKNTSI